MKQKITIKVRMGCERDRLKAVKVATDAYGVTSVVAEVEKDQLVVIGVGVDSACLTKALRKKVSDATIVSIA